MLHRNMLRPQLGGDGSFTLEPRRRYATACPKCSPTRGKAHAKSLMVYRDEDTIIRYKCYYPGCEWNEWQKMEDPGGHDTLEEIKDTVAVLEIPSDISIPADYKGDALYWYRTKEGKPLYAVRRINLDTGKIYVPFVYSSDGVFTSKGAKWPTIKGLYGAETLPGKTKVVIVEGEKAADAAKLIFPNSAVVAWRGGANGIDNADFSLLAGIETALLWPDNDEPGKAAMNKVATMIPCAKIKIADVRHLPAKHDLADNLSQEDIRKAIENARELVSELPGVMTMEDIALQMESVVRPRSSGFDVIDAHTKLPGSGLLVIEGRTKHGKSALAVALSSALLYRGLENTILYYSYEMMASSVYLRFCKTLDPSITLDNYTTKPKAEIISDFIKSGKLKIVDQSSQTTLSEIVMTINKPKMKGSVVVIDYLQIVPMHGNYGMSSRQLALKGMLDELRVAAHKNGVLVMVLSQLTPDYINPRNDAPREAKDIHFSADMVLRVWNSGVGESHPEYVGKKGNYFIHVYLNRDGESNVRYAGDLTSGAQLDIINRLRE